jgi:aerobic carbon-monoxide dehydrogenase large subunit
LSSGRLDTWVQRVTGVPMESRTTTAEYDATTGQYTLYAGSGRGVAKLRLDLAHVLGVPADQARSLRVPGHGREFRNAQLLLSRIRPSRVGREPSRQTSEVDL